jgi:hypothetical protein
MPDYPKPRSNDPRDLDHGEIFRRDNRQLPVPPAAVSQRGSKVALGVAAAAILAALYAITR